MNIQWSDAAVRHLTDIYDYISSDSPQYARRMMDRITARSQQISQYPESGHVVPEYERPDICQVLEGPYRLVYRTEADRAVVLAVIHGARLLPPAPPQE